MPRKLEVDEFNKTGEYCPWCGSAVLWEESRFSNKKTGEPLDPFLCCVKRPKCLWTSAKKNGGVPGAMKPKSKVKGDEL